MMGLWVLSSGWPGWPTPTEIVILSIGAGFGLTGWVVLSLYIRCSSGLREVMIIYKRNEYVLVYGILSVLT